MANFETGISGYVRTKATVYVSFPIDHKGNRHECCDRCEFHYSGRSGITCALSGELLLFPDKYVGAKCPLNVITEDEWKNYVKQIFEKEMKEE